MTVEVFEDYKVKERVARIRESMSAQGIIGGLIFQRVDLYYLSSIQGEGILWISASDDACVFFQQSSGAFIPSYFPGEVITIEDLSSIADAIKRRHGDGRRGYLGIEMDIEKE